jgi:hypothetical protein
VLLASFAVLRLAVDALMATRQLQHARRARHCASSFHNEAGDVAVRRPALDDPIITFSPTFTCQCPRALKVLITETLVGLLVRRTLARVEDSDTVDQGAPRGRLCAHRVRHRSGQVR